MLDAAHATPLKLEVNAGGGTSTILIGDGLSDRLASLLDETGIDGRRFIVSNPTIWKLHRAAFERLSRSEPILIPDGERHKTLQTAGRIYEALIRAEADRASVIVAVGGGVVGDVAGFAAATYLRGVTLVQVPTTLLAQVDSAIGGKVGVNHQLGKNLIGAFHQAAIVAIDPVLLKTLPRREFRSGLYEVVKYGMIASRELFDRVAHHSKAIFARDPEVLLPAIAESCRIKADIVSADERESGLRRVLNYGHTIGHALEAVSGYTRWTHGEAVALGIVAEAHLARRRGLATDDTVARQETLLRAVGLPTRAAGLDATQVLEAMGRDKKARDGRIPVILAPAIGTYRVVYDVTPDDVRAALGALQAG